MLLIITALTVFGAVTTLTLALFKRGAPSAMASRIQELRERTIIFDDPDAVDLELPFAERVLKPGIEGIASGAKSILPQSMLAEVQRQLVTAGNPMTLNAYVTFWMVALFVFGGLGVLIFLTVPANLMLQKVVALFVLSLIGWMMPKAWLKGKAKARQKQVVRAMPDAMDLITTSVEAGLGLDAALARVAEKATGPLAEELSHMLRDVAMGKLRKEALTEMADRLGVEELTSFINSIIQAEQLGVGIAQVLRVQSDQLRTRRRQRAEQAAHEAPIKMLFPLVLFVFPAFLIVVLGPAGIRLAQAFG